MSMQGFQLFLSTTMTDLAIKVVAAIFLSIIGR